jgi:hypothetical protein
MAIFGLEAGVIKGERAGVDAIEVAYRKGDRRPVAHRSPK